MADLLSIGASGVRAYQSALGTVSENIANAGNAAYARRTANVTELGAAGLTRGFSGMGVRLDGVSRAADMFRAAAVRTAAADLSRTETGAVWMERVQSALTDAGLSSRLGSFFNAARTLAADPAAAAPRAAMLEAATSLAQGFTATGAALTNAADELDAAAGDAAARLGSLAAALAETNRGLGRAQVGSTAAAGLADQRDALLEEMSQLVDVGVELDAAGRASVRAGGSNGPVLVAGTGAAGVTFARLADGNAVFSVVRDGELQALTPTGGALGGIADAAARIRDARASLDALATDFVADVNTIQAEGRDLSGALGAAMFAIGDAPTDISLALTDPAGIAAAAVGGGTRDNANLVRLEGLRGANGAEARLTSLVAGNAAALGSRRAVAEAQGAIRDGAVAARDAVSGVDLETEAVDLLRFQQAYQASSRVIQIARDTFQTILEIR